MARIVQTALNVLGGICMAQYVISDTPEQWAYALLAVIFFVPSAMIAVTIWIRQRRTQQ